MIRHVVAELLRIARLAGVELLELFLAVVRSLIGSAALPRPGRMTLRFVGVDGMDVRYEVDLPAIPDVPAATRIVGCRFYARANGSERAQPLEREATLATFEVPEDSDCQIAMTYVDAMGNQSAETTLDFHSEKVTTEELPTPGAFGELRYIEPVE